MEVLLGLLFLVLIWVVITLLTTSNDRNKLRRKLDNLKRKAEKAYAQNEELRKSLSKCEKELAAETYSRTYINQPTGESESLESIKRKDSTLENNRKTLDDNFSRLKVKYDSLLKGHEKLNKTHKAINQKYEEAKNIAVTKENEYKKLKQKYNELIDEKLAREQNFTDLNDAYNRLLNEHNELKKENEKLKNAPAPTISEYRYNTLKSKYNAVERNYQLLKQEHEELKKDPPDIWKEFQKKQRELNLLKEEINNLSLNKIGIKASINARINELHEYQQTLNDLVENDDATLKIQRNLAKLKQEKEDVQSQIAELIGTREQHQATITTVTEEKNALKREYYALTLEYNTLKKNYASLCDKCEEISSITHNKLSEKKDLNDEIETLKLEKTKLENTIKKLSTTKNILETAKMSDLSHQKNESSSAVYNYGNEIKKQIDELNEYIQKISDIEQEIEKSENLRLDDNLSNALDLLIFFKESVCSYKEETQDLQEYYISCLSNITASSQEATNAIAQNEAQNILEIRKIKEQLQSEVDGLRSQIIQLTQQKNELEQPIENNDRTVKEPRLCQTCRYKYICIRSGRGLKPKLSKTGRCSLVSAYINNLD